jgi:L-threonylcarbamoyladenylate synthase
MCAPIIFSCFSSLFAGKLAFVEKSSRAPAQVLPTDSPDRFEAAVARAAECLRAGQLVALPTETVYGLAANALDRAAVNRIFAVKCRPAHNPIIVHVAGLEMARRCVAQWPAIAQKLAEAFWPGPLTLVLPRAQVIPDIVTAGGSTVGVRWPSHPFTQAVIRACGFPLAAPSANLSGQVSPTNAGHVRKSLGDKISLIIDGGQTQLGIESTVLDLTSQPPRVLRPGMIQEESLWPLVGELAGDSDQRNRTLKSPGLLEKHYSPKARLSVLSWGDDSELESQLSTFNVQPGRTCILAHTRVPSSGGFLRVSVIAHDAEAFARAIYAELHRCDEQGAELIVVEAPPDRAEWRAIADRLRRGARNNPG